MYMLSQLKYQRKHQAECVYIILLRHLHNALFQVHSWVNEETILKHCLIGYLTPGNGGACAHLCIILYLQYQFIQSLFVCISQYHNAVFTVFFSTHIRKFSSFCQFQTFTAHQYYVSQIGTKIPLCQNYLSLILTSCLCLFLKLIYPNNCRYETLCLDRFQPMLVTRPHFARVQIHTHTCMCVTIPAMHWSVT